MARLSRPVARPASPRLIEKCSKRLNNHGEESENDHRPSGEDSAPEAVFATTRPGTRQCVEGVPDRGLQPPAVLRDPANLSVARRRRTHRSVAGGEGAASEPRAGAGRRGNPGPCAGASDTRCTASRRRADAEGGSKSVRAGCGASGAATTSRPATTGC